MAEKIKLITDWLQANSDIIMNYFVTISAMVLLISKLFFKAKTMINSIKSDELKSENDKQMKQFQAQLEIKQTEFMNKYMQNFNDKLEETALMFQARQEQIEQEKQKQIEEQTIKVSEQIELLKKIKGGESDEKSTV